jgi:hypothetical protein
MVAFQDQARTYSIIDVFNHDNITKRTVIHRINENTSITGNEHIERVENHLDRLTTNICHTRCQSLSSNWTRTILIIGDINEGPVMSTKQEPTKIICNVFGLVLECSMSPLIDYTRTPRSACAYRSLLIEREIHRLTCLSSMSCIDNDFSH